MTHKQYLRKVEKLERVGDSEALTALEHELMENLDSNLDMDFVSAVDPIHIQLMKEKRCLRHHVNRNRLSLLEILSKITIFG